MNLMQLAAELPRGTHVYIAGKMRGLPYFNHQQFRDAANMLRQIGCIVFNPVEHSESIYGPDIYRDNPEGDEEKAGIDGRVVFKADLNFICDHASVVALLPGWETSKGAKAERAVAEALGIRVIEL